MPFNNTGLSDELMIDALKVAQSQRKRSAEKFRPGSAARAEIETEVGQITLALSTIQANLQPTPLEKAIQKK